VSDGLTKQGIARSNITSRQDQGRAKAETRTRDGVARDDVERILFELPPPEV